MYGFIITVAVVYTCVLHEKFMNNVNKIEFGNNWNWIAFINIYTVCDFTYDMYGVKCVTKEKINCQFFLMIIDLQQFEGGPKTLSAVCSLTSSWHYDPVHVHVTGTISMFILWVSISVYSPTSGLSSTALY